MLLRDVIAAAIPCLAFVADLAVAAEQEFPAAIEIEFDRFEKVTRDNRDKIQDWIIDLETAAILAQRLAVVATGEYFISTDQKRGANFSAKRFVFSWAIENEKHRERLIFQDEHLLKPVILDGPNSRFVRTTSTRLDRLKVGDQFFEALGSTIHPPAKESSLNSHFRRSGMFFPVTAGSTTAAELYLGQAFNPRKALVEIRRLCGVYEQGSKTVAEFVTQTSGYDYHRVLVFDHGVPIQVEDRLVHVDPSAKKPKTYNIVELTEEDYERLVERRKKLQLMGRNFIKWTRIKELSVPTALKSMATGSAIPVEVQAKFVWLVNHEVPDEVFDPKNVGQFGPASLMD